MRRRARGEERRAKQRTHGNVPASTLGIHHIVGIIEGSSEKGTQLAILHDGRKERVFLPLIGKHNVYNALAAAGACAALGVDWKTIATQLGQTVGVPGRLQRVPVEA